MKESPPAVRHRPVRPTCPFEELQARSLARRAVGCVAPLSATAVANAVLVLVDKSKAAAGGQGTGLEEGVCRGEGMDRGPWAGQGEDSMVLLATTAEVLSSSSSTCSRMSRTICTWCTNSTSRK
jgi:hypothetical protein